MRIQKVGRITEGREETRDKRLESRRAEVKDRKRIIGALSPALPSEESLVEGQTSRSAYRTTALLLLSKPALYQ